MKLKAQAVLIISLIAVGFSASNVRAASVHAPLGYQLMCLKNPGECRGGGAATLRTTPASLATLKEVNSLVNRTIRPVADGAIDVWQADAKQGDCEEFALAKRDALIRRGLPASSLRIAYVKTRSGEGHAVLIVRTEQADLVLDVLTSKIKPLSQSGLRLMSMASANPNHWI